MSRGLGDVYKRQVFADSEYMVGVDKMDDGSASCWGATKEFGVTMRAEAKF